MADENQPSAPFFTIESQTTATQTPINYFSDIDSLNPPIEFDLPPELDGDGPTLLHQYYSNTKYFIDHTDPMTLSPYKQEILTKVKQHSIFQSKIFNSSNLSDCDLPPNTFDNLSVSLYLVIFPDHFTFSTAFSEIESGDLNDNASRVLSYVSQGLLPPKLLESLKDLNLVWYDGGLICEISDQRKAYSHPLRVLMRVNPIDITNYGFDIEQEYLLNRHPLLCLDPDIRVSKLARTITADSQRWQPNQTTSQTPAEFLQSECPSIFIEPFEPKKPRNRPESKHSESELRKMLMIKLGIIKEEFPQEKENYHAQNPQQENQSRQTTSQPPPPQIIQERDQTQLSNTSEIANNSISIPSSLLSALTSTSNSDRSQTVPSNLMPQAVPSPAPNSSPAPLSGLSFNNSKNAISQQIAKLIKQQHIDPLHLLDSPINNVNLDKALKAISASSSNPDLKSGSIQAMKSDIKNQVSSAPNSLPNSDSQEPKSS